MCMVLFVLRLLMEDDGCCMLSCLLMGVLWICGLR